MLSNIMGIPDSELRYISDKLYQTVNTISPSSNNYRYLIIKRYNIMCELGRRIARRREYSRDNRPREAVDY